jgi:predicted NUDIX family NTP pyrophosphohydrolase
LFIPGGPFWKNKDMGAWSIPKGEYADTEVPLEAARREFQEETGFTAQGPFLELDEIKQAGGKVATAWAFVGDLNPADLKSNFCEIEWPPRSQKRITIPEIDRGEWFPVAEAQDRILNGQHPFLERLATRLRLDPNRK